jgi:hypothetical protein
MIDESYIIYRKNARNSIKLPYILWLSRFFALKIGSRTKQGDWSINPESQEVLPHCFFNVIERIISQNNCKEGAMGLEAEFSYLAFLNDMDLEETLP